jgi:multiple sugar transport system permease protein
MGISTKKPANPLVDRAETRSALLFLLPLVVLLALFVALPVLGTVWTSFFRDITFLGRKWVGVRNYARLLDDPGFWQSLRFTVLFIAVSVPLELVGGMIVALLLNHPSRLRALLRACVLVPWAIPAAVSARVWELIYNYTYGLANFVVQGLGLAGEPVNWLGSSLGAFWAIVLTDAWKTTPFVAIILLAGLSAIPQSIYQQAYVDGAHFVQRFFAITLPLLKPVIVVALLFRTIDALRIFDPIYVLTSGGPGGETTSLSILGYRYLVGGDYGYGSAVSVVIFLIALSLSVLYVKLGGFEEGLS